MLRAISRFCSSFLGFPGEFSFDEEESPFSLDEMADGMEMIKSGRPRRSSMDLFLVLSGHV